MPVTGLQRYARLCKNVSNPLEYFLHKNQRKHRPLHFHTKPGVVHMEVPGSLYLVFKELFMSDVYHIDELVKRIPADPVVIDIGANAGFFDVLLLSKIQSATIYAYEPLPANIAYMEKLVENNPLLKKNIHLYQKAVTGHASEGIGLFMEDTGNNQVVASVFDGFNKNNTKKIYIPSVTLTQVITQINKPVIDVLKMDCEGSEYDIMYHTPAALIRTISQMLIEVHDMDDDRNNIRFFNKYLRELGYATVFEPINDFCYALEAIKQ